MTKLRLADDLTLPVHAVTEKLGFIGTTGGGKTYAASKLAELFWDQGAQFIVLDPVGVWYGLRLQSDGKRPSSITIPIFGGLHSDVPLEPSSGVLVADLIIDRSLSVILDISQFEHDTHKAQFAKDFADRLFFRKKAAPSAVHLFLEECQEFVPQNPQKGEEGMLHAFTRMQKLGRNFGIGSSYITQRPQEVNKKALNLAQTLFVFRTTGLHERKSIEAWIQDKGLDQDIVADLPKLPTGTCHVWSPDFLKVSKVITVLKKETFNASATPEVGAKTQARDLAPIDLEKIRAAMATAIEKAKADDPKELRRQIGNLQRELNLAKQVTPHKSDSAGKDPSRAIIKRLTQALEGAMKFIVSINSEDFFKAAGDAVDKDKIHAAINSAVQGAVKLIEQNLAHRQASLERWQKDGQRLLAMMEKVLANEDVTIAVNVKHNEPFTVTPRPVRSAVVQKQTEGLSVPQQRILDALAWLETVRVDRARRSQVAFLAGASPTSSAFMNNLGSLRSRDLIQYPGDGNVSLTEDGRLLANVIESPLSSADLHAKIAEKLPKPQCAILEYLISIYPGSASRDRLANEAGASPTSSAYMNNLGSLRSLGFIDYPSRGTVAAQPVLFLE